jgi:gliding motility-associated transport system permease protein
MMTLTIARQEFLRLFYSPLAWAVIGVVQAILAWMFLVQVDNFVRMQAQLLSSGDPRGVTDLVVTPMFGPASIILMLVVPLLSMRTIAEERRSNTLPLLLSSPVRMSEIILGKYFGLVGFLSVIVALIALMGLSLALGTDLDLGKLAAATLGMLLVASAFAAAGVFMSSLTRHPAVAAISTFGLLLFLWIIDMASQSDGQASGLFQYLSITFHYDSFFRGIVDTRDVAYYLIFIVMFLALAVRRLDADRLQD